MKFEFNNNKIEENEFYNLIKDCYPLFRNGLNPFFISIEKYIEDQNVFQNTPAFIDLKNRMAYLHISHEKFNKRIYETFYGDADNTEYKDIQKTLLKDLDGIEIFTSNINISKPIFTILKLNDKIKEFLKNINFEYSLMKTTDNTKFTTITGSGKITGEIYFPKPEEENIPENKILIIPAADEEYFIPAISQMNGKGLIISEKGSKLSHLAITSKEFSFNLAIMENARTFFKEGETITIDLDREIIN